MVILNESMKKIGRNIYVLRKRRNMSIEELSEKSGVSISTISLLENNRIKNISIKTLILIANSLDESLETIVSSFTFSDEIIELLDYSDEEALSNIMFNSSIMRTYYPPTISNVKFTSLLELFIILPLINPIILSDIFERIHGSVSGLEEYISNLLTDAWDQIPDSPAKKFAESELERIEKMRKTLEISYETNNFSKDQPYYKSEYNKVLESKSSFYIKLFDMLDVRNKAWEEYYN